MGYDKDPMAGHGFRAMASTRLNEMGWAPDVIERQLAIVRMAIAQAPVTRAARHYFQIQPGAVSELV